MGVSALAIAATGGLAAGAVGALGLASEGLGAAIISGGLSGAIGGAAFSGTYSGLSGNDAETVIKDTLKGAGSGALIGGTIGGIGHGIGQLINKGTTAAAGTGETASAGASGTVSKGAGGSKTPSEIAKSWQGSGKYPGVDTYKDITLKEGKVIYRGEPNGTEYFTTKSAIERSGNSATNVFEGLQVEKNPIHGYRGTMQGYKTTTNVDAAFGITKANPQFGKGGLPQVFVPNAEELVKQGVLVPVDSIPLTK